MLLIVCPLVLLAGFVDSIAGGGGLISLPAYYMAGLPPALASGTNKLAAAMGTSLAACHYGRCGRVNGAIAWPGAVGAFLCSALGALLMRQLPQTVVRYLVLGCIPVAAFFTLRGNGKMPKAPALSPGQVRLLSLLIGCAVGFYDGLVGPGTGTFLMIAYVSLLGMPVLRASGTARLVNLGSNVGSAITMIIAGRVLFALALPAALFSILGNALGASLAIKKGAPFIRALLLVVLGLLMAALLIEVL